MDLFCGKTTLHLFYKGRPIHQTSWHVRIIDLGNHLRFANTECGLHGNLMGHHSHTSHKVLLWGLADTYVSVLVAPFFQGTTMM